ncbi:MAG: condensation domain-containing protein, partial [Acidobacteriota bacterium]
TASGATTSNADAEPGPIPLTPSQEGCLARPRAFLHYRNIARFFELRRDVSDDIFKAALAAVWRHHPALRARFEGRDGRWLQAFEAAGDPPFTSVDLSGLPTSQHRAAMEKAAAELQPNFRLEQAPLVRFVRFARGPGLRDRLFVLFHHVLVDGYSCDLVFDDLSRAYEQLQRGESVRLPPTATPFRTWVDHLVAHADSPEIMDELDSWLAMPFPRLAPLPADHPHGLDEYRFVARIKRQWDPPATRRLTGPVAASLGVTAGEIFAAGLLRTLADWSGRDVQAIHEFHNGRVPYLDPALDVSRTVGYLSYSYPVIAELPAGGDPLADLREVTAQKRRIRHSGQGYSLLRFLHPDPQIRARMKELPLPQVRLNYRGRVGTAEADSLLRLSDESPGPIMSPTHPRGSLVVTVRIADDRLHTAWQYSSSRHERSTIEGLADRLDDFLRALVARVD